MRIWNFPINNLSHKPVSLVSMLLEFYDLCILGTDLYWSYWFDHIEITQKLKLQNKLNQKISLWDFPKETGDNKENWANISKAKNLIDEMYAYYLDKKFCLK